jgi:hypothetical protein
MIRFTCACGRALQAREEHAGKRVSCPACGKVQAVPSDGEGVRPAEPPELEIEDDPPRRDAPARKAVQSERPAGRDEDEDEDERDEEPRRGERRGRSGEPAERSGKATASLILGLLSFPCVFNVLTGIPAIIVGILALRDISASRGRTGGQGLAITGLVTGSLGLLVWAPLLVVAALLFPALSRVRQAAGRAQSQNNLKQVALGMHDYHNRLGTFPAAAIRSPDGRPLLSWRVAILPFIQEEQLYRRFKLDEPWDSPNNKKLLPLMPKTYALPGQPLDGSGLTYYQVFVGPGTVFEGPRGLGLADITDGASNTILVVEAAGGVPWTKPDDLPYIPNGPLPRLGGHSPGGYNVLLADGTVRFFPDGTPERTLRPAITRNDGVAVNLPP